MIIKFVFSKACLLLILLLLPTVGFSQNYDKVNRHISEYANIKALQGKWVLDVIKPFYGNDPSSVNINNINIEIYKEIEFKRDSVFTTSDKQSLAGKFNVDGNGGQIIFNFSNLSFDSGWSVINNNLYIQQTIVNTEDSSKTIYISFVYKRNNK